MNNSARTAKGIAFLLVLSMLLPSAAAFPEYAPWDCPTPGCGRTGNRGNYCGNCGHPAPWMEETETGEMEVLDEYWPSFRVNKTAPLSVICNLDPDSELIHQLRDDIEAVGMDGAFGSVVDDPVKYSLIALAEFTVSGFEEADGDIILGMIIPGVVAESVVEVVVGLLDGEVVSWEPLEVLEVYDSIVKVAIAPECAEDVQNGTAVMAVLVN